jgi:hypothetical protein
MALEFIIGFIELLSIVTTSNYSAIANLYTLKSLQHILNLSQFVFTSRFLGTVPNNVMLTSLPADEYLKID